LQQRSALLFAKCSFINSIKILCIFLNLLLRLKNKLKFKGVPMSDYFLEETQQVSESTDNLLSVENIASSNAIEENISNDNKKINEETTNFSITDSLKNGVDYASSILNSANEWLKENDPLKLPEVEAYSIFDESNKLLDPRGTEKNRPPPINWDPYPSVNYNLGGPSQISSTSSTYSSSIGENHYSSSTLSSLSSDSVVNRPFVGNPNPSGQVFTNPGNEYKYCRTEQYWENEWVCTNNMYGNIKPSTQCVNKPVPKNRYVCT
jgi:hypothetical protein